MTPPMKAATMTVSGMRVDADPAHLADRLGDEGGRVAERARDVAQEVAARADLPEEVDEPPRHAAEELDPRPLHDGEGLGAARLLQPGGERHVRTRARSTSPVTANSTFGSHAATSGQMMLFPPRAW